jgi:predicted nucleotide-binding protein
MNSISNQLSHLIASGVNFNFSNFCYSNTGGSQYAGADKPEWDTWKTRCINIVKSYAAENSPAVKLINDASNINTEGNHEISFNLVKDKIIHALNLILVQLVGRDDFCELKDAGSTSTAVRYSNKVFIVHGHDESFKTEVENFIRYIKLDPIVLHKQPDEGNTIIEKIEKYSDVGYAFILLSPDDIAYEKVQENMADKDRTIEYRARQNVIFEHGYFVAKLKRSRVCCLYKGDVTLPSDLGGLLYKKIGSSIEDKGLEIIKELKSAGYDIKI